MNRCLNEDQLLRLVTAEPHEFAIQRAHVAECPSCAAGYDEAARDLRAITDALGAAADTRALRQTQTARRAALALRLSFRNAAICAGAAAFGGFAALAIVFALGWHPSRSGADAPATVVTQAAQRPAPVIKPEFRYGSADPINDIAYDETAAAGTNGGTQYYGSEQNGELLFCTSGEDRMLCSGSAEEGWAS